jgi:cytochrome c-type biogenesis protein CcmH/NrfG
MENTPDNIITAQLQVAGERIDFNNWRIENLEAQNQRLQERITKLETKSTQYVTDSSLKSWSIALWTLIIAVWVVVIALVWGVWQTIASQNILLKNQPTSTSIDQMKKVDPLQQQQIKHNQNSLRGSS